MNFVRNRWYWWFTDHTSQQDWHHKNEFIALGKSASEYNHHGGKSELKRINKTITAIDSTDRNTLRKNEKLCEMKCFCIIWKDMAHISVFSDLKAYNWGFRQTGSLQLHLSDSYPRNLGINFFLWNWIISGKAFL